MGWIGVKTAKSTRLDLQKSKFFDINAQDFVEFGLVIDDAMQINRSVLGVYVQFFAGK